MGNGKMFFSMNGRAILNPVFCKTVTGCRSCCFDLGNILISLYQNTQQSHFKLKRTSASKCF